MRGVACASFAAVILKCFSYNVKNKLKTELKNVFSNFDFMNRECK